MKKHIILCFLLFFFLYPMYCQNAEDIIKKVDKIMYPNAKTKIYLKFIKNEESEIYKLFAFSKENNQKVIIRFKAPPRIVGDDLIMIEQNVWAYSIKAGRIMKIPSNQSFGGTGFSYGDVVRLNLQDNYNASISSQSEKTWTINLNAKERNSPYFRIELIVEKETYNPVKGTCYGRNNEIIKVIEYSKKQKINNQIKPTLIKLTSPNNKGEVNYMQIVSEELKEYPDQIFNKRNLALHLEEKY